MAESRGALSTHYVGDEVAVQDCCGDWHHGTLAAVPEQWRDETGDRAVTKAGGFRKVWVRLGDVVIPWPVSSVTVFGAGAPGSPVRSGDTEAGEEAP